MSDRRPRHVYRAVLLESWRSLPRRLPELPSDYPLRRAGCSAVRRILERGHIGLRAKLAPIGRTGHGSKTRLTSPYSFFHAAQFQSARCHLRGTPSSQPPRVQSRAQRKRFVSFFTLESG